MAEKHNDIEITIEALAAGGDGFAHYNGRPLYVPKTAPGDRVRARLAQKNAGDAYADLTDILEAGPARTTPPCKFYARCGSCSLQHIERSAYEDWKTGSLKTALAHAGITPEQYDPPYFANPAGRRRATFAARKTQKGLLFGYNQSRSHVIEDITHCLVLAPDLDARLQALRTPLAALMKPGEALDVMLQKTGESFDLVLTGDLLTKGRLSYDQNEALSAIMRLGIARIWHRAKAVHAPDPLIGHGAGLKTFGALPVEIPPGGFLQASDEGEAALVETVLDYAGDHPGPTADLFCGAGTFTGHLIARAPRIYAADSDRAATDALKKAAADHPKMIIEQRDLFKNPLPAGLLSKFDTVICDPPRAGGRAQAGQLAQSRAGRIISVSCNPATFARDAALLQEGGYRLRRVRLIDQFVYTAHCEMAGLFTRD